MRDVAHHRGGGAPTFTPPALPSHCRAERVEGPGPLRFGTTAVLILDMAATL
jgi:hypothetical protein